MASATLTEQMGAMAQIDLLRHQQMLVQEHLDLPRRREDAARRIREYYKTQNIAVTEDIVEQGVRAYFDRRLQFERPPVGRLAGGIASIYVTRSRWMKPVAVIVSILIINCLVAYGVVEYRKASDVAALQTQVNETAAVRDSVLRDINQAQSRLSGLSTRLGASPLPSADRMLTGLTEALAHATALVRAPLPSGVTVESRDAVRSRLSTISPDVQRAAQMVQQSLAKLSDAEKLVDTNGRFVGLLQTPEYSAARVRHPALQDAERTAREALADADRTGVDSAVKSVAAFTSLVGDSGRITSLERELQAVIKSFASMGLTSDELKRVAAVGETGSAAIRRLDIQTATGAVETLRQMWEFAHTPLTLQIVDRVGVKSGVERRYDASGGKSWFLVVEAVDPNGNVVPMSVTSAETGATTSTAKFGVRVSQEEYEKVKADKRSDGHIDDRVVGEKPANSFTVRYGRGIAAKPDLISEW